MASRCLSIYIYMLNIRRNRRIDTGDDQVQENLSFRPYLSLCIHAPQRKIQLEAEFEQVFLDLEEISNLESIKVRF